MPRNAVITAALGFLYAVNGQDDSSCDDPGHDPNALRIQLSSGQYLYTCNVGFMMPDFSPNVQLTCEDGMWGPMTPPSVAPLCVATDVTTQLMETAEEETTADVTCSDPGEAANAEKIVTHFDHGGEVYFTCNPGFCAVGHRARTIILQCRTGTWSQPVPDCQPCDMCAVPDIGGEKYITMTANEDFTATLQCDEGYVIKPGQDFTDMTMDCIEGGVWADEIPTCSVPSQVVCGEDYISVVVNKNMLTQLGFDGGIDSIALTGRNIDVSYIDDECFAEMDDGGENFMFTMLTPFTDKCRTEFISEDNNYKFSNKVVWKQNTGAVTRQSTVLDFECIYEGLFVTSLKKPIKLAISTRTYYTDAMEPFTISMAIYHARNYTGLVDNVPILHRGKRYFIELLLHEEAKGTPFLKHCYGSSSYLSEQELAKIGTASKPSQLRTMLDDGCPAPRTLVRLEVPPNDASRRFSFMFPKISVGIAELQFVYIHCEVQLKPIGFKPSCFRQNDYTSGGNGGIGRRTKAGGLGKEQFFLRSYAGGASKTRAPLNDETRLNGAFDMATDWQKRKNSESSEMMSMLSDYIPTEDPLEGKRAFNGRKRREAVAEVNPVSFGPIIFPEDDEPAEGGDNTADFEDALPEELFAEEKDALVEAEEEIEMEILAVEVEELDQEVHEETSSRTITIVVCMLVGGLVIFIISMVVGLNTICFFGKERKDEPKHNAEKRNSGIPDKILSGNMKELNNKIKAQYAEESCNTSITTADSE